MAQKKKLELSDYEGGGGKNDWLDKLYTELINHNISPEKMWDLLEQADVKKKEFFRGDRNYFAKTTRGQKPLSKDLLYHLFSTFQFLNLDDFVIANNETDADRKNPKLFTSNDWQEIKGYKPDRSPLIDAISFPKDNNNNDKLIKTYEHIASYFRDAKERILVFELTFKGSNTTPNQLTAYQIAQAEIYHAIEDVLKFHKKRKSNFKYIRVFSLSKSEKYFPKTITNGHEMKTALAAEASRESFQHILWCLEHYPEFCEFYVTGNSIFRHHVLIDSNYYLTEDYIRGADNLILPDCLYVDDITQNQKIRAFANSFDRYVNQLQIEHKHLIQKDDIEEYIKRAIENLKLQIVQRKNSIPLIKEQCKGKIGWEWLKNYLIPSEDIMRMVMVRMLSEIETKGKREKD